MDILDQKEWEEKLSICFDKMYKKEQELGCLVSSEHGIGYSKINFLKRQLGDTPIFIMQEIKHVFDPKNILNSGKICF